MSFFEPEGKFYWFLVVLFCVPISAMLILWMLASGLSIMFMVLCEGFFIILTRLAEVLDKVFLAMGWTFRMIGRGVEYCLNKLMDFILWIPTIFLGVSCAFGMMGRCFEYCLNKFIAGLHWLSN